MLESQFDYFSEKEMNGELYVQQQHLSKILKSYFFYNLIDWSSSIKGAQLPI
jgi:hypothetical protein